MSLVKNIIKYLIGLIIIFFSFVIMPLVKLKFGILYAERFGQLATTFDNYIYSRNKRNKIEYAFFHLNNRVANEELLRLWRNEKKIFFSKIAKIVFHTSKKFNIASKIIIDWDEMETMPRRVNTTPKVIKTDEYFHHKGKIFINRFSISCPFICITSRDDMYVDNKEDTNFYNYKNFKFMNFDKSINNLIKKNYSIIRVTKATNSRYKNPSKKFFYFEKDRTDHSDVYLLSQSKYNIYGSFHGANEISSIFRKKALYLNMTPFNLEFLTNLSINSIFVPKKIYSKIDKRFLKFNEIANLKYYTHYNKDYFEEKGLEVIDNTPDEINMIVEEFDNNFDLGNNYYNCDLQDKFWSSFEDSKEVEYLRKSLKINISKIFLENNKDLI